MNAIRFSAVHLDQIKPGVTLKNNRTGLMFEVATEPKYRGKSLLLDIAGLRPGSDIIEKFTYVCNPSIDELDIEPNPPKLNRVC